MSYATMLALVKAAVEGVTDIGVVHDYRRFWTRDDDFQRLYATTIGGKRQIRGWDITRMAVPTNERQGAGGLHIITHQFMIRGYLSVEDASATEKTFQALVDAVVQALDEDVTLSGSARGLNPAVATTIDMGAIGKVLCHYAEIEFSVAETVARTYS